MGGTDDSAWAGAQRPSLSIKAYVMGLVALLVVGAGANVVYQRRAAGNDARQAAAADAGFGAGIAARDLASNLGLVRQVVATTAADPAVPQIFGAPAGCTLSFSGAGPFARGHLDVVAGDGTVACSSLPVPESPDASFADAPWLAAALEGPVVDGPLVDGRTGASVLVVSSPVPGHGMVVAFLDLDAVGPALAATLGGPRHLEFVVTNGDGSRALSRSIDPARWVDATLAGTPFAEGGGAGAGEHADLDGEPRLYGQATVDGLGWQVFAGARTSEALAAARALGNRQLALTLAGLAAFLAGAFVIYRRIARPIARLSTGVRAATARASSGPIAVSGPAEVSTLVDDFNRLLAAAEREREATSRLAAIVESSADAIFGMTLDGVITSWNAGAEQMFGYTAAAVVGLPVTTLIPPDRHHELAPILARVRNGDRVQDLDTLRLRQDGTPLDVSLTVCPVWDADGRVAWASAISRDVTARKRAEADRRALEARLHQSERLQSLGQLAGGIAHDFNNLLAAIINYGAFVAEEVADRPAVLADVEQIQAAADRATRLTKQLLIFGRRETIQRETLDLNAIVADIRNLLARSIGEDIELVVRAHASLPNVTADRGQLEQVLLNLAVNARDAMPAGGTLTIETRAVELDEAVVRLRPDVAPGSYVELTVSDTGTGMSADVLEHIFEPFFTTKPAGQGTGLGLATVYGIVTDTGGTMSVYSEPGIGTTFRTYLPVAEGAVAAGGTVADPCPRGHGETVLVVEDEPAVVELTSRILRQNGYAVLEAATWEQALTLASANELQLLLTDSVMPQMSGRALAQRVQELRPGLAVLYMSGYSEGVLGPRQVVDDGVPLVEKPFNRRTLLEKVHAAIATPRSVPTPVDRSA